MPGLKRGLTGSQGISGAGGTWAISQDSSPAKVGRLFSTLGICGENFFAVPGNFQGKAALKVKVEKNQKQTHPPGELLCPKDSSKLLFALKGGAGYCPACCLYVQAAGVPMPAIDRPSAKAKAGSKRRRRTARAESR